jgi:hypothetical protein
MKQYVQTDLAADRQVANTLAELIIGGTLASIDIGRPTSGATHAKADDRPTGREQRGPGRMSSAPFTVPRLQIRLQAACQRPLP